MACGVVDGPFENNPLAEVGLGWLREGAVTANISLIVERAKACLHC